MRLNQFIAHNTKYSRREADKLIEDGRVNIHKQKATPKSVLEDGDKVFIDGKYIKPKDENVYTVIVYNKPRGEIVSKKDDRGRRTIYDGMSSSFKHFIPVGRLDFASEGLLILSDSKLVTTLLMQSDLEREYLIKIDGPINKEITDAMENGITLEDARAGGHSLSKISDMEFAPFKEVKIIKNTNKFSKLKVSISEGKNRELRRFFAFFKREVLDLKRVRYGFVNLNALPSGKTRYLTKDEYKHLHDFIKQNNKNTTPKLGSQEFKK